MDNEINAVIFDMDGVLVDSEPIHVEIENLLFKKLGLLVPDDEHATYMGKASDVMWKEIIKKRDLDWNMDELVQLNNRESQAFFSSLPVIEPMTGLVAVLELIAGHGIPMAVASSSAPETIEIILDKTGLRKYFHFVVNSQMAGKSKPEPDIFLFAAKLLNIDPAHCMVIEDSENGIKAAKTAGMYCVAYQGGNGSENQDQKMADERISDYSQLKNVLMSKIPGWDQ
jgi:beta-phosphoglucomutase